MDTLIFGGKPLTAAQFDKVAGKNKKSWSSHKKPAIYFARKGYPETAERYIDRLYDFLFSLEAHTNS